MIDLVSSALIIALQIGQAPENPSVPGCLFIDGIEYCRKQDQPTIQQDQTIPQQDQPTIQQDQTIPQQDQPTVQQNQTIPQQNQTIIQQDQTTEVTTPIYKLDPETMKDPRYGQVFFTFNSVKTQNDCIESLLLVVENLPQRGDTTCADTVITAFGDEFITNPTVQENIFRMTAHYTRSVLKREFKLPLGLERRLTSATGLVVEQ
ncbi:MAG: hypothetical protein QNJ55_19840 [Xenococcus sp. MO_188.B8]|nr:hypothetical protein [Xenococcus sp. MO_188.B8]